MTLTPEVEQKIIGLLEPIADQDWHGKWRIQKALTLLNASTGEKLDQPDECLISIVHKYLNVRKLENGEEYVMTPNLLAALRGELLAYQVKQQLMRESVTPTYSYWKDVFKNADCFERWVNNNAFWEQQPYGTRFYFGELASGYIHRAVLQAAVKQLNLTRPAVTHG